MDCHTNVGRGQNGEYVCLQESNEGFERIHEEQQEEPCDCRQTRNDVHLEDGSLQEDGGCQREYGENHMACEHIAVKSNGKSQNADYHGEELQEPNDGGDRCRHARRAQRLEVMEEAKLLQAPEVEVDKGNSSQRPGDGDGAHGSLCTGDKADDVGGKDEEEQRSQEGNVLLEAFADNVGANAFRNEVVAELEDVRELTVRYERELAIWR